MLFFSQARRLEISQLVTNTRSTGPSGANREAFVSRQHRGTSETNCFPKSAERPSLPKLQSAAERVPRLMCAMADNPINDYYVVTSRRGQQPERWSWEILRKSTPLGIKMTGEGYQSDATAQFAGKQALAEFLADLLKEEKRQGK